jgi:hypothetical protein
MRRDLKGDGNAGLGDWYGRGGWIRRCQVFRGRVIPVAWVGSRKERDND